MKRKFCICLTCGLLALGMTESAVPASADEDSGLPVSSDLLQAMYGDLGLPDGQARALLTRQEQASDLEQALRNDLGPVFAGAWFTPETGMLTVAITDASKAKAVTARGADTVIVQHSASALDAVQFTLDEKADRLPPGITGWHVDPTTNRVVIEVSPGTAAVSATQAVSSIVGNTAPVSIANVPESPTLFTDQEPEPSARYNVRGGDAWFSKNFRCSIGFSAKGRKGGRHFITAGHCTEEKGPAYGYNRKRLGRINGSVFGSGGDFGKVDVTSKSWVLKPWVNRYKGGKNVTVAGAKETPIGGRVCRSGSTTKWHCGRVTAKKQTVRYPGRVIVKGLTKTSVCGERGDSGGSYISGRQAQGVTSGGSGDCKRGGTTYFSPIQPALKKWNLHLVTG